MSFFSFLTGGSKTAEKVVDGVSSGIDAMFFSDEEKSQASQKILDWKLEYAKSTAGQSIARRVIAFTVTAMWCFIVLVTVVYGLAFGKDAAGTAWLLEMLRDVIMVPFSIIVGFYFLAHVVGKGRGQP